MKIVITSVLILLAQLASATTWNVEVGGTSQITPYYEPENIEIQVGDIVKWTFVSGLHNVTSTSGPEPFASGDKVGNPNGSSNYSKTFELPGFYTYNCTFKGHSQFQSGTIIVRGVVGMEEVKQNTIIDFTIWPNPASDVLNIEKNTSSAVDISIKDITGKTVWFENSVADLRKAISVSALTKGIYFVEVKQRNYVTRKRLVIS